MMNIVFKVYYSAVVIRVVEDLQMFTIRYDDDHKTEDFYSFSPDDIRFGYLHLLPHALSAH